MRTTLEPNRSTEDLQTKEATVFLLGAVEPSPMLWECGIEIPGTKR